MDDFLDVPFQSGMDYHGLPKGEPQKDTQKTEKFSPPTWEQGPLKKRHPEKKMFHARRGPNTMFHLKQMLWLRGWFSISRFFFSQQLQINVRLSFSEFLHVLWHSHNLSKAIINIRNFITTRNFYDHQWVVNNRYSPLPIKKKLYQTAITEQTLSAPLKGAQGRVQRCTMSAWTGPQASPPRERRRWSAACGSARPASHGTGGCCDLRINKISSCI